MHSDGKASELVDIFLLHCKRFLATEATTSASLRQYGFTLADEGWNFTLPRLHRFLVSQSGPGEAPAYMAFRKRLFNSPVNSILAEMGAEIVIAHSRGKVDLTTYRLQRQKK